MRRVIRGVVAVFAAAILLGSGVNAAQAAPSQSTGDDPQVLIVGGQEATEALGTVSIQYEGDRHRCTGTLILQQWVLTAGHCAHIIIPGATKVRAGSVDRTTGGEYVGVKQVIVHPHFTMDAAKGDQALVQLDQPVRARPIPMALRPAKVGETTRIMGWGRLCKDPARPECAVLPTKLQQLDMTVVHPSRCDLGTTADGRLVFDPKFAICAGSADGQAKMACNGDSGGPMMRKIGGTWFLVGSASADGDDLVPHPNDCNTGPDGVTPGVGIWIKLDYSWILRTLFKCDPAAAQQFASSTRH